jgi:flavin reductase (DIM6/NTAB) family NADH-FMN oxidoreductase RutF
MPHARQLLATGLHWCEQSALQAEGNNFNVNILAQGSEGPIVKAMLKKFGPGEDRFDDVKHTRSEETGCVILDDALSVLECTVTSRMDAGDHYIVYGTVNKGQVLNSEGVSAVHHRKSGATY